MSIREVDRPSISRRPSEKVRIAAARVRVESDRQVGRPTPRWIRELAESGSKR